VRAPASADGAAWIAGACRGRWGSVGALLPNDFAAYLRVDPPVPEVGDWWAAYRRLYEVVVAGVGARHTSTPEVAWFAVWEGHGWELRAERARLREEDRRRQAMVRSGLRLLPRFELPNRTYHVVSGPLTAVGELQQPGSPHRWQRPDLVWPDDRRWFVVGAAPTRAEAVTLDRALDNED
jgi:hypothetical protein